MGRICDVQQALEIARARDRGRRGRHRRRRSKRPFGGQHLHRPSARIRQQCHSGAATDASLVNGWGLSAGPTTPWWAANNGTNTSTLYSGTGVKAALTVSVPGAPTGTVFNGNAADFVVSQSGKSGAARFLFSTEGGTVLGWTPAVNGTVCRRRRRPLERGCGLQGARDR